MSDLITVEEALQALAAHPLPRALETIDLRHAHGRTLAKPVAAKVSKPPAAVSAMDGYAVRLSDVNVPGAQLVVVGEAPAGKPFKGQLGAGQAIRIFTGGEVPSGADHIVIQEDTISDGDAIICRLGYDAPRHIRPAGLDFSSGDQLLDAGTRIDAGELTLIAAANHGSIEVYGRLRVGILANGDELKPPGSSLKISEIPSSNSAGLSALISSWGDVPVDLGIASDSVTSIVKHLETEPDIDLFLPVGGASVGDHDHMRSAFEALEYQSLFQKVAVKPGKPTWFSKRGSQRVLGLPGNPASALVCAHLFLKPLLTGAATLEALPARLTHGLAETGPRETFLRATAKISPDAVVSVSTLGNQDSSRIIPFVTGNALIRCPAGAPAKQAGDIVNIISLRELRS